MPVLTAPTRFRFEPDLRHVLGFMFIQDFVPHVSCLVHEFSNKTLKKNPRRSNIKLKLMCYFGRLFSFKLIQVRLLQ